MSFCLHSLKAKYHIAVVNTSKTAVMYHKTMISPINIAPRMIRAIAKNTFEVIKRNAITKSTGKLRNIRKLNITFIFTINIRK